MKVRLDPVLVYRATREKTARFPLRVSPSVYRRRTTVKVSH